MHVTTYPTTSTQSTTFVATHSCTTIPQPLKILSITLSFYVLLVIIILHIFTSIVLLVLIAIEFNLLILNINYFSKNIFISPNNKSNTDYNSNIREYYYLCSFGMNEIIFYLEEKNKHITQI